jgi:hypothetical protein
LKEKELSILMRALFRTQTLEKEDGGTPNRETSTQEIRE